MTLEFSGFRAIVKEHVRAKFHRAKCSGYWVILHTEKRTLPKALQSVATAPTVKQLQLEWCG